MGRVCYINIGSMADLQRNHAPWPSMDCAAEEMVAKLPGRIPDDPMLSSLKSKLVLWSYSNCFNKVGTFMEAINSGVS